ncbi:ferric-dicitrate binding protein FerR (iron transport regulator) [Filimonas zeae]|uniref:FecR protein domain-containing protein n=1 Tax=Filimonas zeae TaxID=1737353 RepID=A0A917J0B2_9BACT|nr:FecR domain-containing protein [Filimonas zeae]MDR6340629.1 ferric-dicitrate binding protein FerR (iron transport regulator) [Filimonas zeae]GGH73629.1 hypothetical protein GCM10011379_35350 [Filimonas zeae]
MEKYNSYTTAEFLESNAFIAHIRHPHTPEAEQWAEWLKGNPASAAAYLEAAAYLRAVYTAERIVPSAESQALVLEGIRESIADAERKQGNITRLRFLAIAAAACVTLVCTGAWYFNSKVTVTTRLAERKQVTLPDNSVVTLNANSTLSYYRAFTWHKREVWLTGEGLFKVTSGSVAAGKAGERFTAYVSNLQVQVLGTTFNIKERRKQVAISLLEGRVQVSGNGQQQPVILNKGQVIKFGEGVAETTVIPKLTNQPQAWADGKIIATGMSVQDIIDNYEDTYGYRIVLDNPEFAKKTIDGTISIGTDDNLLFMLANILNADIERQGNVIYLRSR